MPPRERLNCATIDEYIALQDEKVRPILEKTRQVIKAAAPDTKERISWDMPTFHQGENICHFAAQKNHLGFYPGDSGVANFLPKLEKYKHSKGAIQFPYKNEIPYDLIREIVEFRVKEATSRK